MYLCPSLTSNFAAGPLDEFTILFLPGLSELVLHSTAQHPTRPLTPCVRHLDARVARRKELEQADDDSFSSDDAESVASEEGEDAVEVVRDGERGEGEGFVGAGLYRCGNAECQFSAAQGRNSIALKMAGKWPRKWPRNGILKKDIRPN